MNFYFNTSLKQTTKLQTLRSPTEDDAADASVQVPMSPSEQATGWWCDCQSDKMRPSCSHTHSSASCLSSYFLFSPSVSVWTWAGTHTLLLKADEHRQTKLTHTFLIFNTAFIDRHTGTSTSYSISALDSSLITQGFHHWSFITLPETEIIILDIKSLKNAGFGFGSLMCHLPWWFPLYPVAGGLVQYTTQSI